MQGISEWSIPVIVVVIVVSGYINGVNVFETFIRGAKGGITVALKILPALVALITAVGILKASGALDMVTYALAPITNRFGVPSEVIPLALLRPISGSGAMVIFNDILHMLGPDSLAGRIASVMEGSTETTFYTIAVYFGATAIRRTRHTVAAALIADLTGFAMSVWAVSVIFK